MQPTVTRGSRIITTPFFLRAAALALAAGLLALLLPASPPAPRAEAVAATHASVVQSAEKLAVSSMLRPSGYTIVKDKLD